MQKASSKPFGYVGKIFERRREAELFVEAKLAAGTKATWKKFGKKFKVYYQKEL